MDVIIFAFFAIMYSLIFIWGFIKHNKTSSFLLIGVVIALIYDNAILALGTFIGEGELLKILNYVRFWTHALITPTLILFSFYVMQEAGVKLTRKPFVKYGFIVLMLVAILVEYFVELQHLSLTVNEQYGVLSYASMEEASGPPPMILIVLAALLFASIMLIKQSKWWWMLIGTVVMTIGSAISLDINSNAITNAFELLLIFTLMKTAIHFSHIKHYNSYETF